MNYQSEQTNLVCQAIEDARLEFLPLEKSGVNNFFKNKKGDPHLYSTLDNIFDACMPSLHKHKLSVVYQVQIMSTTTSLENVLTTTITHLPSSQFILSATTLGNQTAKSQDVGSAITYLRRYQIQAMLNLEADFEDDGNSASGRVGKEANVIETTEKTDTPKRKYNVFDKDGKIANVCTSFGTYIGELNKSLDTIRNNHPCSSATIVQLQDIQGWAETLPKEHKRNADTTIKKCKQYIILIKGE
mgnify:FL=1|tara:strand:+ start:84 stop:815 length:732 start_codon:yes stop_codon:yes gene_type:complete